VASETAQAERTIQCVECGEVAKIPAKGWKAYLGGGFEGLPLEVAAFCPACAVHELGDTSPGGQA
jgi:hypothetical protein